MKKLKRLFIISRPIYWAPSMTIYLWALLLAGGKLGFYSLIGLLFFSLPMGIIIFGINDITDREHDARNPRKGDIDGAVLVDREVPWLTTWIAALSLAFIIIFLAGGRYLSALSIIGIIVFSYTYSVPPIRLKTRQIIDALSNGFWLLCIYLTGLFVSNNYNFDKSVMWQELAIVFFSGVAFHSLGAVLDYDADKLSHQRTISQLLGKRLSAAISFILLAICFVIGHRYPTIRAFFGICTILSFIILLNPDPRMIARLKAVFFIIVAILPGLFLVRHLLG